MAGPEGLAPSRSVLETNPSARTSRTYWCPRPVARRLPLFGRQPCIYEHLSGEIGGAGRLRSVSSALQVRRAAIITTAPKWTRRRDLHPRTSALQAGPLAVDSRSTRSGLRPAPAVRRSACWPPGHVVIEKKTAAQVTRRWKTSPTSVLSDRGLRFGGAGGSCTRTVRIKSPLCCC